MKKSWYEIKAKGDRAEVYIYDEIGIWGVTAAEFVNELRGLSGKALDVYINSPGGDVFDGIAIYNALSRHDGGVSVTVDGLAASIASVIAQAGSKRTMSKSSTMMVHEPWGVAIGNPEVMEKMKDTLDLLGDQIAGIYADRAGGTVEEWRATMAEETWYKAEDAIEAGLADAIGGQKASAMAAGQVFNLAKFKHAPDWAKTQASIKQQEGDEPDEREEPMDPKILAALGVAEDGDVLAAIESLKAQNTLLTATLKADAPEKGEIASVRAELDEANKRIIELDNQKNADTLLLRERLARLEAESRVERALAQGKITPASRAIALKVAATQTEEEFNTFLAALPKIDLSERGSMGNPEFEAYEPTASEIAIAKQMGAWNEDNPNESRLALMRAKGAKIPAQG